MKKVYRVRVVLKLSPDKYKRLVKAVKSFDDEYITVDTIVQECFNWGFKKIIVDEDPCEDEE
jgi:hypothetical protein